MNNNHFNSRIKLIKILVKELVIKKRIIGRVCREIIIGDRFVGNMIRRIWINRFNVISKPPNNTQIITRFIKSIKPISTVNIIKLIKLI